MTVGILMIFMIIFFAGIMYLLHKEEVEVFETTKKEKTPIEKAVLEMSKKTEKALYAPELDVQYNPVGAINLEGISVPLEAPMVFKGLKSQLDAFNDKTKGFVWYKPKENKMLLQCVSDISESANLYSTKYLTKKGYIKIGEY